MTQFNAIGQRKPLIDGREKVTGALRFASDVTLPDMVHARLVTSPYAHARIQSIDTAAAEEIAGVTAVLTAADLPAIPPTPPNSWSRCW